MSVKWWKYKDTDTLNRVQYEEAIEIQDIMIKKKFTTKYMDQRFRFHILQNIHRQALRDNIKIDSLKGRLDRGTNLSIILENGLLNQLYKLQGKEVDVEIVGINDIKVKHMDKHMDIETDCNDKVVRIAVLGSGKLNLSKAILSKVIMKQQHSSVYGVLGNKEIKHKPEVVEYNSGKIMMAGNIEYKGDNNKKVCNNCGNDITTFNSIGGDCFCNKCGEIIEYKGDNNE